MDLGRMQEHVCQNLVQRARSLGKMSAQKIVGFLTTNMHPTPTTKHDLIIFLSLLVATYNFAAQFSTTFVMGEKKKKKKNISFHG